MIAITIDGYALAAIVVVALALIVLLVLLVRLARHEHDIRIARMGVFIERERLGYSEKEKHSLDPFDDKTEVIEVEREPDWPTKEGA